MFNNQPKIDVKPTKMDLRVLRIGWIIIVLNVLVVFAFYFKLPESIPTHFNLKGEADGYGSKSTLWMLPIIGGLSYFLLFMMTTKMKPWNFNYPTKVTEKNAPILYALCLQMLVWLNLSIAVLFFIITLEILLKALEIEGLALGWTFIPLIAFVLLFPFWYIIKMFKVPKS